MANGEVTARYVGVATEHDINPGDEQRAPSVFVKLRVTEGPEAGREINWYGSLKEGKAQEITFNQLRAMGWQDNDIVKLTGLGSTKVEIVEKMDEWQGKIRPRYTVWAYRGERPTLRDEDKATFAKKFKALASAVPAIKVSDANAAPSELPAPRGREDGPMTQAPGVPF